LIDDLKQKIDARIHQLSILQQSHEQLFTAIGMMETLLLNGKKILVFGNGGSASQSSHLAAELVNKFYFNRKGLPAISLTTDTANITSIANDTDYKFIFSRQVEALGHENDAAIGITTSGTSLNVLEGLKTAKKMKMKTIALCGIHTDALMQLHIDVVVDVKTTDTPIIQEMHLFFLHMMAETLEKKIFGKLRE
jgi:D-sedoheptulose 7-phosphate isomerase